MSKNDCSENNFKKSLKLQMKCHTTLELMTNLIVYEDQHEDNEICLQI